ncbi:MAG TPA: FHA domain-containing protein, partial [Thermoanaerobaculia bacterium]|nr:FHA domain-containing protein [Thermoanaerobaculia bacterium]
MPFLVEHPAESQVPASRVEGDELLIGRGTNAGLRLDDSAVALEHARIERSGDGYRLHDLGSDTGTYLNGRPVGSAAYLKDGDTLGLGGTQAQVRWRSPADP